MLQKEEKHNTSGENVTSNNMKPASQRLSEVLDEVQAERSKQDDKWGPQNHAPPEWLMILGEEVGEANKAALEAHFKAQHKGHPNFIQDRLQEYRTELVQVAAVAVAMIESFDRAAENRLLGEDRCKLCGGGIGWSERRSTGEYDPDICKCEEK
jgi:hypothetical protein